MKYILIFAAISLAALSSSSVLARGHDSDEHHEQKNEIISYIQKKLQKNATLRAAFVTVLTNAGLNQYVINSDSVNYTSLQQHLFSVLPTISSFITTNLVPSSPKIGATLNAMLTVIQNLQNDANTINKFVGHLLTGGFFSYATGPIGSFVVNFADVQNNPQTARILNKFIEKSARDILYPGGGGHH